MARQSDRLSVSLQENLLVLACFSVKSAPVIRNTVPLNLFGQQVYRDLLARVYDYIDKYKVPPDEHLPDLFDGELDKDNAKQLVDLMEALYGQRGKVNEEYALNQLGAFVRQQSLKGSIIAASEAIQQGDLDKAETELQVGLRQRLQVFAPGQGLADGVRAAFTGTIRTDVLPLGIKELDQAHAGPGKGEFLLLIAPPKRGKSWFLVHVSKSGLRHRLKVLYVTLELSEPQILGRHLQSLFSMTRFKTRVPVTRLRTDDLGRLVRFEKDTMSGRLSFDDAANRKLVEGKLARLYGRDNLVVKQFPAGQLTMQGLNAYMDMLEQAKGFVPDVLVLDYADYMKIDPRNYRFEIGQIYNDLRGLAVERNIAVATAKRSNREGTSARMVTETHAAEDYSAIYTADTVLTYSQTAAEKELGLARLFLSNTRVADRDGFVTLMSQAYPVGQFCLESVMMMDGYWGQLEQAAGQQLEEETA